jgi:hypothetical protein
MSSAATAFDLAGSNEGTCPAAFACAAPQCAGARRAGMRNPSGHVVRSQWCMRYAGLPGQPQVAFEDFDVRSEKYTVFRTSEYSWYPHGATLLDTVYRGTHARR